MIQDWKLERYRLGELPPAERAEIDAALTADPSVKARLEALETDSKAVLARMPAAKVAAEVERRSRAVVIAPKRTWPIFVLVPALAMTAALVIAFGRGRTPGPQDDIIAKGDGPKLLLYKHTPRGQEQLFDKSAVRPHDVVQVRFDLNTAHEMVVFSIDGAGHATLHFPLDGNPVPLASKGVLSQSFELDDAPGYERFFLVTSNDPLSSDEVMDAARALALRSDAKTASLTLPKGSTQRSVRLDKVTP